MQLSDEQKQVGKENFNEAVGTVRDEKMTDLERQGFTRRSFIKGAAAAVPSLGAVYFGYEKLKAIRSAQRSSAPAMRAAFSSPSIRQTT